MSNNLDILEKHRGALLLAEIAAWLHMFGKLQVEFLKGKTHLARTIPKLVPEKFPLLDSLLKDSWVGTIWDTLPLGGSGTGKLSIRHLIRTHEDQDLSKFSEVLRKLLIDAHGRGSGIEKGALGRSPQHEYPIYLSTAIGLEAVIEDTDIEQMQNDLYDFLQKQLDFLTNNDAKLSYDQWSNCQKNFIENLQRTFSLTVAETRRPLNDITLFDQTAISVAFFKAALAQNLLSKQGREPARDNAAYRYSWRLLKVGLHGLAFWGDAIRIGDLLARKKLIETALDQVKNLLEVRYPLGSEVYRDENCSIFVVPDIDNLLRYTNETQSLEELIQSIARDTFSGETQFTLSLSDRTRDTLRFGKLLEEAIPKPSPQPSWLQKMWQGAAGDICPVCGYRPQGPSDKASRRKVCDVCEERRANRSKQWIDNSGTTTIWIDEVADQQGQIALITSCFEIGRWLNNSAFNTMLSFDPKSRSIDGISAVFDLQVLTNDIQKGLKPEQVFEDNLLGQLVPDQNTRGNSDSVEIFYDLRIKGTDLETTPYLREPELLALSLIRQQPSFARIRRTWETTKTFGEEIASHFKYSVGERDTRIKLKGRFISSVRDIRFLAIAHTYELKLGTIRLSITCTQNNEFLTVENLQRIAMLLGAPKESSQDYTTAAKYVRDYMQPSNAAVRTFTIEEPTGYGSSNRTLGVLEIAELSLDQSSPYVPAISILTEPRTFMALVPADKARAVVQHIKEKYETEMGKVRNRLPLTVGIVFADRRTPLPALLDAGRRMLKQPVQDECWRIKQKVGDFASKEVILTLEKKDCVLKLKIPTIMGDSITEDVWYPYWCVESNKDGSKPESGKRDRQFTGVDGKEWIHVCNLLDGDIVHLQPSRFDFEYLDTAARRFEVSYADGRRRGGLRPARPYYLEQFGDFECLWKILDKHFATSQIDNLIGLIETKRREWVMQPDDSIFQKAVSDILYNAHSKGDTLNSSELEQLLHAAISGQLTDVVELYITILKRKVDSIGEAK